MITEPVLAEVAAAVRDLDATLRDGDRRRRGTPTTTSLGLRGPARRGRRDAPAVDIPNDSPALIMYTSGTTGRPKGAVLTHANLAGQAMTYLFTNGADINNDVGFIGVPLFHIAGIGNMIVGLLLGRPTVLYPLGAFDPGRAARRPRGRAGHRDLPGARAVAGGVRGAARQPAQAQAAGAVVGCRARVGHAAARHGRDVPGHPDPRRVRPDRDVAGDLHAVGRGRDSQARFGRQGDPDRVRARSSTRT